ncbi:hypothetical protein [Pseudoscardovia suis]|uniref:hypothetical protein n=1 Tax=Pseudoscardovia suis TaxID=987063 RepID=UPI0012FE9C62|nr:hypothetical protein [Pseudoscardovia suis]
MTQITAHVPTPTHTPIVCLKPRVAANVEIMDDWRENSDTAAMATLIAVRRGVVP